MDTLESLREKLSNLVSSGRSGIVSLCGCAFLPDEDDPFWGDHEALVYIEPLDTVVAFFCWGRVYQTSSDALSGDSIFHNFVDREDSFILEDFGLDEKTYLDICTDSLLNDMAHDESECPELDCEDYMSDYVYPADPIISFPDTDFTITGVGNVAEDIKSIRTAIENGTALEVALPEGGTKQFFVSASPDGEYALSTFEAGTLIDEDTGDDVPIQKSVQLLRALDWRTFYAKSRLFIYQNWFDTTESGCE